MFSHNTVYLNTGNFMPQLGYGTWQADQEDVEAGVYEALLTGYRHLDLAKVYGNQRAAGKGIRRALDQVEGLQRSDIFITSKLWNDMHRPECVEAALDDTLAELQLDYLDLYLIHWPVAFRPGGAIFNKASASAAVVDLDRDVSIVQTWKAMTQLPKFKVRSVGVSNFSIEHLDAIINATGVVPAVNQIERHPRLPNPQLVDYCANKKIVLTAYSPFGNNPFEIPLLLEHPHIRAVADRLTKAHGTPVTPAQVILAWSQLGGHAVIPKSVTPSRIRENFQAVSLDDDAVRTLQDLAESPQRFNIPYTYRPRWDIDVFGDAKEKNAAYRPILEL